MFWLLLIIGMVFGADCVLPNATITYSEPFSISAYPTTFENDSIQYNYTITLQNGYSVNLTSISNYSICPSCAYCPNENCNYGYVNISAFGYNGSNLLFECSKTYYLVQANNSDFFNSIVFGINSAYLGLIIPLFTFGLSYILSVKIGIATMASAIAMIILYSLFQIPLLFMGGISLFVLGVALMYINI